MNKFTFDKKEQKQLEIQIEDKKFTFNPYSLTVTKACEKFTKCQQPLVNRIKALKSKKDSDLKEKEIKDIVLKCCNLVRDTVNQILGKGAYERIFAGRTVNFYEHQKLIEFVFNEITEFIKHNPVNVLEGNESITR